MTGMKGKSKDDLKVTSNSEKLYRVASFLFKATSGALADPSTSAVLNETFDLIVTDPGVRRRDRFIVALDERLTELEKAGIITVQDLEDSTEISALLLRSIQAATRSSGTRKLQALLEVAIRGVTSKEASAASNAQVMLSLVDRMTEHHIIALHWMTLSKRNYTLGQFMDRTVSGARESLHYGQPVYEKPDGLKNPSKIHSFWPDFAIYVEYDDRVAFEVAEADLRALGLTEAHYKTESFMVGRKVHQRQSSVVAGHKVSKLGMHLLSWMGIAAGVPVAKPSGSTEATSDT